jgi:hypothetical protein
MPEVNLHVESGDWRLPVDGSVDLVRPAKLNLIFSARGASGWDFDLLRNGLVEALHSERRIVANQFCTVIAVMVHSSCAFRVVCRREDSRVQSDLLIVRLFGME